MNKIIIEIKAKCGDPERIREILRGQDARYVGKDHQVDTYFIVVADYKFLAIPFGIAKEGLPILQ